MVTDYLPNSDIVCYFNLPLRTSMMRQSHGRCHGLAALQDGPEKAEFSAKRKQHYNMGELLRRQASCCMQRTVASVRRRTAIKSRFSGSLPYLPSIHYFVYSR